MNKKILAVGLLTSSFILGACSSIAVVSNADQNTSLKILPNNTYERISSYTIVDENTGVNYLIVTCNNLPEGVAITPRLNANGTPYTSK